MSGNRVQAQETTLSCAARTQTDLQGRALAPNLAAGLCLLWEDCRRIEGRQSNRPGARGTAFELPQGNRDDTWAAGQLRPLPRRGDRTEDPLQALVVSAFFRVFRG